MEPVYSKDLPVATEQPPAAEPSVVEMSPVLDQPAVQPCERALWPAQLTRDDLEAVFDCAEVPVEWRDGLASVARCESKWSPGALGDSGAAKGLWQIHWYPEGSWQGWSLYLIAAGVLEEADYDAWANPVVNARAATGIVRYSVSRGQQAHQQWTCRS